ncbi:MAG: KH domain-containing protein, partial [Lentisphaerae bacterium]
MNDNMNSTLTDVIQHLTRYLGVDGEIIIQESTPKSVHVIVRSNEAGRLIGRKGRTLQAIRHLVYSIMKREDMVDLNIILDVDGYNDAARPEHNRNRSGSSRDRQRRRERPSRRRHPSPNRSRTQDDTRTPALIATEEPEEAMAETITSLAQPSSADTAPSTFPETDASHFSDGQPPVSPAEDTQSEG